MSTRQKIPWPLSLIVIYGLVGIAFLMAGFWLAHDLVTSRASIIAERASLAVETSRFMSQWFGTTILNTDYVLRDLSSHVQPQELESSRTDPGVQKRLSAMVRQKMESLPSVMGLGLLDRHGTFVAAADERVLGLQTHSKLILGPDHRLENRTTVEYVPADRSANQIPSLLVSRPIFSSQGEFLGGALAAISLRSAQGWIEGFHVDTHDTLAMFDEKGVLLAINPPRPEAIGTVLKPPVGIPRLDDQRSSHSFVSVSPVDGRERIYGISKIEDVPLNLLVGFDLEHTLKEWQQRTWQLILGAVIFLVLFGLVLYKNFQTLVQGELLRKMSVTDPLTGISNRRHLMASGEAEVARAVRYKQPTSLLMVDIDHFKAVNDNWGHPTGDRVIQALARVLGENLRQTDHFGRIGGEEFAAVLPQTEPEGARLIAERIRQAAEDQAGVFGDQGTPIRFTVSVGVAGLSPQSPTFSELLGRADRALYEAKRRGRNTVVVG